MGWWFCLFAVIFAIGCAINERDAKAKLKKARLEVMDLEEQLSENANRLGDAYRGIQREKGKTLEVDNEKRRGYASKDKAIRTLQGINKKVKSDNKLLRQTLLDAQQELRLIREKDTAAVYDPTLRIRISTVLDLSKEQ